MHTESRRRWEERHRGDDDTGTPSPFVVHALDVLSDLGLRTADPSRALDLACGRGRHALLLAERGFRVDAVDFSIPALSQLQRAAAARNLAVACLAADVGAWTIPTRRYALVVVVNFLERALFPALRAAVLPGGALVYETHVRDETGTANPLRPDFLLEPGELDEMCRGWRILSSQTGAATHGGKRVARAGILAQRPLDASPRAPTH